MKTDGYHQGNAYRFTGSSLVEYGVTWLLAEMIEGTRKGSIIHIISPEDKARRIAKQEEQDKRQQESFARLH